MILNSEPIYDAYPRHAGKQAALKAIRNAVGVIRKRGTPAPRAWLLGRVQLFADARRRVAESDPTAGAWTKYPQGWFNQGHYDDDPAEWERGSSKVPIRQSARDQDREKFDKLVDAM